MRGCKLTLNEKALLHNLEVSKAYAPNARVVAMVKANAYGHGLINVASILDAHVDYFGVACLSEGIQLREAGCQSSILLMEGFFNEAELADIRAHGLSIVLHERWQVEALMRATGEKKIDVWLKYDSGMHRLGFSINAFNKALKHLSRCDWVADDIKLMTHFACADSLPEVTKQHELFQSVTDGHPFFSLSAANSAAVISFPDSHYQYIRPGIMLYGSSPLFGKSAKAMGLKSVMTFSSKIIALRECKAGESVGYGADWVALKPTMIATVAAGYGDGYPRHITSEAFVVIDGISCPIIGRISMDMLNVDVSSLSNVHIEQDVILWGDELPIDTVASFSNTISYDLLCRMGLQVHR